MALGLGWRCCRAGRSGWRSGAGKRRSEATAGAGGRDGGWSRSEAGGEGRDGRNDGGKPEKGAALC